MGREVIRVKGVATGRYIAMNVNGSIYSTVSRNFNKINSLAKTFIAAFCYLLPVLYKVVSFIALPLHFKLENSL